MLYEHTRVQTLKGNVGKVDSDKKPTIDQSNQTKKTSIEEKHGRKIGINVHYLLKFQISKLSQPIFWKAKEIRRPSQIAKQ